MWKIKIATKKTMIQGTNDQQTSTDIWKIIVFHLLDIYSFIVDQQRTNDTRLYSQQ